MRGAALRLDREQRADIRVAWMTAKLTQAAKIPGLDSLLGDDREIEPAVNGLMKALALKLPAITMADWAAQQRR